ncbi:XrtA/PEP-CTERM system TPR-repeat protein PrsT [Dyella sp.]|uniref:XrtA/PEP-CTERM system TPR-repeat protein PrsT n=1 Tax=Dyella sp. TaxID=1869338 RepID=UPI002D797834|nr:XrtA/PEP-CTERM system TPR-repeat protein PrsT [Dyella sp.]HET7329675.1 XrtA/PEP-CTERM system TPR-repeat protein PrsT [Dyella sp.]
MLHSRTMRCVFAVVCAGLVLTACGLVNGHGSLNEGTRYQAEGKYRAASIEAKKVLQRDQKNGNAWLLLGESSLMLGKPKDAISDFDKAHANGVSAEHWAVPMGQALRATRQFEKLLKTLPSDASFAPDIKSRLAVLRGDALRGLNKPMQAKKAYESALKLDADNASALMGLAWVAVSANDPDTVREHVQKALAVAPDSPEVWAGKGDLAFGNGALADAESSYQKALDLHGQGWLPQDRFATRVKLATVQMRRMEHDKALANIQTLEKMSPRQPQPHYLHAALLYRQGHLDDAVAQLQKVLKASPDNVQAQLLMGAVNYAKGNDGQSEMYLSNVLGMDGNNVAARKLLALTYYREGRSDQALDTLRPVAPMQMSDAALLAQLQRAVAKGDDMPKSAGGDAIANTVPTMANVTDVAGHAHDRRFDDVRKALANGYTDKAIDLLKAMPKGDASTEAQRITLLVMAYIHDKRVDEAVKTAAAHAAANPKDSEAQLLYGTALVANHQYDKARSQYEKAHTLDAGNLAAMINLGSLDVHEHHYAQAEKQFKTVLKTHPDSGDALTALGKLAALQHDRTQAIFWFKKAIDAAPKSSESYVGLIMLYSRSGQPDQAVEIAEKLADAVPDDPAILNTVGATRLSAHHADTALKPLMRAVKLAPGKTLYRINLARAQIVLKDTKSAEANLEKVLKTAPADVPAVRLLTALKLHDHDFPAAMALAQSLQHRPTTKAAGFMLEGDLYMTSKSYQKAAETYQEGLKVDASRPLVIKHFLALKAAGDKTPEQGLRDWLDKHADDGAMRMLLAQYYMDSSQNELAARQYERVLKAYPSNLAALNNLAWLYVGQHDPKGLVLAERAYSLSPDSPAIGDTYGWALLKSGQLKQALPVLQKAAKAAPNAPTIRYHLAMAQSQNGNNQGARATLAALRKTDTAFPERLAAEKLYRKLDGAAGSGAPN